MKFLNKFFFISFMGVMLLSCGKNDNSEDESKAGSLVFSFKHLVNGNDLELDAMKYTNTAGNKYEVTEIQWFISDITLNKADGSKLLLDKEKFAHYIDTNIRESGMWEVKDPIPPGDYDSISITFGIKGEKNKPLMYTDPPESDMLWPINLGGDQGGYHYMKLNGFWIDKIGQRNPFNFHLGVGQERDAENNIVGFVQNWFEVELPASSFSIAENERKVMPIIMNVEKWWDKPHRYNHDEVGGKIMQNQEAMRMGVENGRSVFSMGQIASFAEEGK